MIVVRTKCGNTATSTRSGAADRGEYRQAAELVRYLNRARQERFTEEIVPALGEESDG